MHVTSDDDLVIRGIRLAPKHAGFVRKTAVDNAPSHPGLDITIQYAGGTLGEATAYVYDRPMAASVPISAEIMKGEFEKAVGGIARLYDGRFVPQATYVVGGGGRPQFLCAELTLHEPPGPQRSFLYLTEIRGAFLKFRITLRSDSDFDHAAYDFLCSVVNHNWPVNPSRPQHRLVRTGARNHEVMGLVRLTLFDGWDWSARDLESPNAMGVAFACHAPGDGDEIAYLLVADGSDDPDEPDIATMAPGDVAAFDQYFEAECRRQLPMEGRTLHEWMPSTLHGTGAMKKLVSRYVTIEHDRLRLHTAIRFTARGRRLVVGGGCAVDVGPELAASIADALRHAVVVGKATSLGVPPLD